MNSLKQNMEKFRENGYFIAEHIVSEKKLNAVLENIFRIYFKYNPSSKLHELQEPWKSDLFHEEMIKFRKSDPRRFSLLYDSAQTGASLIELFSDEPSLVEINKQVDGNESNAKSEKEDK